MQHQLLIQSLKESRAQILLAFLFAGHAMDVEELMTWTGMARTPHYHHLAALCAAGFLAKQTLSHGRHVYLLGSEMLPVLQAWVAQIGAGTPKLEGGALMIQESSKMTSGDDLIIINPPQLNIKDSSVNNNNKAQESSKMTPADFAALLEALAKHKIVGKKKDELIGCEWVTAGYVHASIEFAIAEGHGKYSVGIAINRMLEMMEQPARGENGHIENCQCEQCSDDVGVSEPSGAGYSGGMFAEYFNQAPTSLGCVWQDDDEQTFKSGHPFEGQHRKQPACKKPLKSGSHHWCEEHYQIGVETYGTGQIPGADSEDEEQGDQP